MKWLRMSLFLLAFAGAMQACAQASAPAAGATVNSRQVSEAGGTRMVNRVYLGQDVFVPRGQQIRNAVCVFCSVQIEGDVAGRVMVFFGNLSVTGRIGGTATVLDGNAVFDAQARVSGDTVVLFGNAVYETEDVLSGSAYVLGGHSSKFANAKGLGRRFSVGPRLLSILVLLGCAVLLLLIGGARHRRGQL